MKKQFHLHSIFGTRGFRDYYDRDGHHRGSSASGGQISYFCFKSGMACQYFRVHRRCVGTVLTLLASGINRKYILLLAVLMFAVSNAVYAYTAHFSVMLAFRIIPALCHPVFFL